MTSQISSLAIYQTESGALELREDTGNETFWATQKQLSQIFEVDVRTVNEHLKNIFKEQELEKFSTIRKFRIVQQEGSREVTREIDHYNLDTIISVGYRVNSKKATQFRKWATKTLKNHITQDYTINPQKLQYNQKLFLSALEDIKSLGKGNAELKAENIVDLVKYFFLFVIPAELARRGWAGIQTQTIFFKLWHSQIHQRQIMVYRFMIRFLILVKQKKQH